MAEAKRKKVQEFIGKMAICYDFDKTLSPDDMQSFKLIPSFGVDKNTFWKESNTLARENLMDNNLAWMYELVQYSRFKNKSLKREYFRDIGAQIPLYKGVETWFNRVNRYAANKGIQVEHYIISSGLKEIIEGSCIAKEFKRIYASSYLYSTDGVADWPAQAINYTNKTQYIFRIAKGFFEEYDDRVNNSTPEDQLYIPYQNFVYIGDSATDIPCMRLVTSKGGYAIGVFDPEKNNRKNVYQLFNDKRVNFYAPADYSSRSKIYMYMKHIVDEIACKETMKMDQKALQTSASWFKSYMAMQSIRNTTSAGVTTKNKKDMDNFLTYLKDHIEGNID